MQAQVAAQLHSEYQAMHDPLTGLPNRRIDRRPRSSGCSPRAAARRPGRRVWVFLLDLDGFKWVNDSWGHDTGDQLVIEVAARLRAAVPEAVPVARVGGDEFLLAVRRRRAGRAARWSTTIRGCFARPLAGPRHRGA